MSDVFRAVRAIARDGRSRRPVLACCVLALVTTGVLAACADAVGAGGAASGDDSAGATSDSGQRSSQLGQPVRDGNFTFTVNQVDCSQNVLGTPPQTVRAEGVYCLVSVTVTNHGDVPQAVVVTAQRAYDRRQTEYPGIGALAAYLPPEQVFPGELAPGDEREGVLVFDVPVGTVLTELRLHEGPFSAGVGVELG